MGTVDAHFSRHVFAKHFAACFTIVLIDKPNKLCIMYMYYIAALRYLLLAAVFCPLNEIACLSCVRRKNVLRWPRALHAVSFAGVEARVLLPSLLGKAGADVAVAVFPLRTHGAALPFAYCFLPPPLHCAKLRRIAAALLRGWCPSLPPHRKDTSRLPLPLRTHMLSCL